jgi:hypothetical protein
VANDLNQPGSSALLALRIRTIVRVRPRVGGRLHIQGSVQGKNRFEHRHPPNSHRSRTADCAAFTGLDRDL